MKIKVRYNGDDVFVGWKPAVTARPPEPNLYDRIRARA